MIRLIDLTEQIYEDDDGRTFAFFCTIKGKFIELSGAQHWSSWKEFEADYKDEQGRDNWKAGNPLERFKRLIPEGYFNRVKNIW